jgi:hypothetical protein
MREKLYGDGKKLKKGLFGWCVISCEGNNLVGGFSWTT